MGIEIAAEMNTGIHDASSIVWLSGMVQWSVDVVKYDDMYI